MVGTLATTSSVTLAGTWLTLWLGLSLWLGLERTETDTFRGREDKNILSQGSRNGEVRSWRMGRYFNEILADFWRALHCASSAQNLDMFAKLSLAVLLFD